MKEGHKTKKTKVLTTKVNSTILKVLKIVKMLKLPVRVETFQDLIRTNHRAKQLPLNQFSQS